MLIFFMEWIVLRKASEIYLNCVEFIKSWSAHPQCAKVSRKVLRSLPPFELEMGPFFGIRRHTFVTIMSSLILYTINLLMSVKF